jgi:hypothetical protein
MNETQKAAVILHGYWTGLILCGRDLPVQYAKSMNIADAINRGDITEDDYGHVAVQQMVRDAEKIETDAYAVYERRQMAQAN